MTSGGVSEAQLRLAAWRESGADRLDPVRHYFIEALAARAETQGGEARRLLDQRLSELLHAYQADIASPALEGAASEDLAADNAEKAAEAVSGPLAELAAYIASQPPRDGAVSDLNSPVRHGAATLDPSVIDYFRDTWSRVGARRLLQQSQAKVPENAGPLNSTNLVYRSLSLMRELSPEYLHHFLTYVDALSWLEQLSDGGLVASKEGRASASAKKAASGGRQR